MKCGDAVEVIDWNGGVAARAVAQCGDGFLTVVYNPKWASYDAPFRNGEVIYSWIGLLGRLVWLIGHPVDKEQPAFAYSARSTVNGFFTQVLLQNQPHMPVRASELAKLLGVPEDEMRARVHDYLVVPETVLEEI